MERWELEPELGAARNAPMPPQGREGGGRDGALASEGGGGKEGTKEVRIRCFHMRSHLEQDKMSASRIKARVDVSVSY